MLSSCQWTLSPHLAGVPRDLLISLFATQKYLWHFLNWFPSIGQFVFVTKFECRCLGCTQKMKNPLTLTSFLKCVRTYAWVSKSQSHIVDTSKPWEIVLCRLIVVSILKTKHLWNSHSKCICLLGQKCLHRSNFSCFKLSYITREFHLFSFAVTHEKRKMLVQYS